MAHLYLVGTPIGNLEDITFRAIRTLKEVSTIACEDTRVTRKLCHHFEIETPLKSYHEHNKEQMTDALISLLQEGQDIALVSDAGLPLISDPGYELVVRAREEGIHVVPIPGANAGLTALMASGLPSFTYTFLGFLPRKAREKLEVLQVRMFQESTLILYESPFRIKDTLQAIAEIDSERNVTLGRELTKKFEQIETGSVTELIAQLEDAIPLKGEFVVLIEGKEAQETDAWYEALSITEHVEHYIAQQMKPKQAIKQVAQEREMPSKTIYNIYHDIEVQS
ncbi:MULTISPECIES: 16S rRNA (cytidine(1402)-2'-O)-methyltransferase [unclassified Staphylococcus]|uniref:16S rRNA (cytidine(1402)-2'-O)-methyltransferase n=1 Tax=unclassified Staphylococcus TaxID=91994 RepID=UPI0021D185E8|nr:MULTISPECIES: 16S rRNA (cytidine(1402)-2'-O)-methyltransferase [unclassified Staphylococcus]UXR69756.1 16S rRNA (cytidine(1402)-2'-O)-methyltransferase [Staphylococcus sp. IVB6246]UXR71792.1 16S rRNA (cytidine(1402)-2'-O)-methyltransferase [Staphylococcus sp. IVB6240]UXR74098.1 16S rRNA (cytidine(1402)-2'-O)-methyltransferase [Staphylococcus sp. IVB6238]UXR76488.1 16S rRNA (cytidine(1402)-2'-O)-methyltransferase [Staphylococcus sp. IVB6233]UXR80615.1 16S rRNA (cytidine(1402)-2'-O)-methyltra